MSTSEFRQFICRACGLVYDEALGDADSGLAPGTRFEDIPEDWACPLCGVTKADFELMQALVPMASAARAVVASMATGQRADSRNGKAGVVIVGGGTAGWALVEQLRARSASLPITLVSACSADRYDKPRLSVALHQGVSPAALPRETGLQAAGRLGVRLLARTAVSGVSMASRTVRTSRGTLRFDELVLAHGAQARSCDGLPDALTWRINDLSSYQGLRTALAALRPPPSDLASSDLASSDLASADLASSNRAGHRALAADSTQAAETTARSEVIVVGAGLVGCELANDLALAGYSVRLIESAARPLPMAAPEQSQALLEAWSGLPLTFEGGVSVRSARRRSEGDIELTAAEGRCFTGRLLVSAVGLSTPSRLAAQAGLRIDNGIAVDGKTLSTGVAHVHALGDCISIDGRPQRFIEPIHRQARLIADRICGNDPGAYNPAMPPVRVKTTSLPLTLAA